MAKRLVSIGECMVELKRSADGRFEQSFAGDSFNTAYYARLFARPDTGVDYVTALGTDKISDEMLAFMQEAGIGTSHIRRLERLAPGLYMIHLENGERSFSYWRSHSAARHLADDREALGAAIAGSDIAFFSGITLAILPPQGRRNLLAELAAHRDRGHDVAFDPNIRAALWPDENELRDAITEAAACATIVLPSFDDEQRFFGDRDCTATARRYRALGARFVAVKNNAAGIWLASGEAIAHMPAFPVEKVIDSTSAGDSFNGAFLARRLAGEDEAAACAFAARIASTVIGHHGALIPRAAFADGLI